MSKSQKILKVFGIFEIIGAVLGVVGAIQAGGLSPWVSVVTCAISAYLLLAAAKDAAKIMGAWIILLADVILNALSLVLAIVGGGDTVMIIGTAAALAINLFAFIAANNVKKQAGK